MDAINLAKKFALFSETWTPKIVADLNDCHIKVAKFHGQFVWHQHDDDELFLVVKGSITLRFRDREVTVGEGELLVVPKGVEHMPIAEKEAHILLIEPKRVVNTGDVIDEKRVEDPDRI